MTTIEICELFRFTTVRRPKRASMNQLSGWKTAGAIFLLCAATAIVARAQTFTTLVSFDTSYYGIPGGPATPLIQGTDGNFYGTTMTGGANNCEPGGGYIGCGTVFRVTPEGSLSTFYSFGPTETDGIYPEAGLVLATDGNFYGATRSTIYKLSPDATLTTLYTEGPDFVSTLGGLIQGTDGNFYGTTNLGSVFKITPAGKLTTLHTFEGSHGYLPIAGLVQATDGNIYGTTEYGGANHNDAICFDDGYNPAGCGTVFKIAPGGKGTTFYSFCSQPNCADGAKPSSSLIQAADGNLYGITAAGGANGYGTMFRIGLGGKLTTLYNFCSQPNCSDGYYPWFMYAPYFAPVVQGTDGKFYGTTFNGGTSGLGEIFDIVPGARLRKLHDFCYPRLNCTDGNGPLAGMIQGTDGNFYGTTFQGGINGDYSYGTVFRLSMGLRPFVSFIRNSGKVGQTVRILGQGFTGTTSVSFNGTPAKFTVKSDTYLTATVPAGATTGTVTVATSAGTLKSNVAFRVTPQILSFSPASGPAGTSVVITGKSLSQASVVTLACKWKMSFTVDSETQITAIVPQGATSGRIAVSTPGGHVESTASFTVTP